MKINFFRLPKSINYCFGTYFFLLFSLNLFSQGNSDFQQSSILNNKKINWEKSSNWSQVVEKAKKERKMIFIDCFATWCLPCKKMDTLVYSKSEVANKLNKDFISLKLQMDSTINDDEFSKQWYPFSKVIQKQYKIVVLPTFLFFDPNGSILHKGIGFKSPTSFIELLGDAFDSSKQFYKLVSEFNDHKLSMQAIRELAFLARNLHDEEISARIARYYICETLTKAPLDSIFSVVNSKFIQQFDQYLMTTDKVFKLFIAKPSYADSISGKKGTAKTITRATIFKDFTLPVIKNFKSTGVEPRWKEFESRIEKRFGKQIAINQVINAKLEWYRFKKDRVNFTKYTIEQAKNEISDTPPKVSSLKLNNWAWDIFGLSDKTDELLEGLKMINLALTEGSEDAGYLDTKANILYKIGYVNKAIEIEEKVVSLAENGNSLYELYKQTLEKMKAGLPTWSLDWN